MEKQPNFIAIITLMNTRITRNSKNSNSKNSNLGATENINRTGAN